MTFEESVRSHILEDRLRQRIENIRSRILEMGGCVEQAIERALAALVARDRALAYSIIFRDQRIDGLEKEIDRLCLEFLVREQPAAGHLRFVYSAIKINADLERVGDYAESVARQVLFLDPEREIPCRPAYEEIGALSRKMLHDSVQAFVDQNPDLAGSTIELESRADEIRSAIRRQLLELHRREHVPIEWVTSLLITAARFERVADQAVAICEEVLFMCTGEIVRHKDGGVFRVLFLSEHDSARSQMALGIARALAGPDFAFESAGVRPQVIDPRTAAFMASKGIDLSSHNSKGVQQIQELDHYHVIVLLSRSAREIARRLPAKPILLDWCTPDPSHVSGGEGEIREAYEKTFDFLSHHIRDFVEAVLRDGE